MDGFRRGSIWSREKSHLIQWLRELPDDCVDSVCVSYFILTGFKQE